MRRYGRTVMRDKEFQQTCSCPVWRHSRPRIFWRDTARCNVIRENEHSQESLPHYLRWRGRDCVPRILRPR